MHEKSIFLILKKKAKPIKRTKLVSFGVYPCFQSEVRGLLSFKELQTTFPFLPDRICIDFYSFGSNNGLRESQQPPLASQCPRQSNGLQKTDLFTRDPSGPQRMGGGGGGGGGGTACLKVATHCHATTSSFQGCPSLIFR